MSEGQVRRGKFDEGPGEDPDRYIQTVYMRFLQGLFNFMPAGHFHWEPDFENTEITITAEAPIDQAVVEKFPSLVVTMGPCQWQGFTIDQMQSFDMVTGKRVRTDLRSGYFVVYAVAGNDVVARRLGQIVEIQTRTHQRLLEGPGGFHHIARPAPSMNAPSPPGALVNGDPKGLVMVQVNVPFSLQWTWSEEPTAPAKARDLNMITQERRASDFPYTSPRALERVELAMSTAPVVVRRVGATITTEISTDGIDGLQAVIAATSTDEA